MCVLRHRSSVISLVFPLADEGSRVRVTVQEREREEEGMARMLEREEWSQQSQTYLRRIAEMETEGEECVGHLEGEIDRLLNKVSNDVCVCVCVCVCVRARARSRLCCVHSRSFAFGYLGAGGEGDALASASVWSAVCPQGLAVLSVNIL